MLCFSFSSIMIFTDCLGIALAALCEAYALHSEDHTRPYPGIPELLDELTRRGLTLAVLSNKPHEATLAVVARLLPRWKFAAVIGQRDDKPLKPDPSSAIEIAQQLAVPT